MTRSMSYLRAAALLPLMKLLFVSLVDAFPLAMPHVTRLRTQASKVEDGDAAGWLYLIIAVVLVLLGGVFAGLTIALMGQDEIYLQVLANSGEGSERKNASKVLRLLKRGKHWVLVSLLLSNVITNETLPIMLDRSLGGGWQAVLGSTVLIVIFGEVVPQSICVRYGLPIGAFMSSSVLLLMWLLAPVAWPTAKLLDYLLGEDHGTTYKKAGLKTLVTLHRTLGTSPDERLNHDEVTIISAVLDLKAKPVGSIMTPMEDVFTLSADTVLDDDMMNTILSEGYSRIPIYAIGDPENFIGMLLVKLLITYDPEDCMQVQDFHLATLPETRPETSCLDIINFFQEGKSHMILVSESPGEATGALGVCTLEDVIEELIGEEIVDESDVFVDVHKAIRRMNPVPYYRIPKQSLDDINEHTPFDESQTLAKTASTTMERKMSAISDTNAKAHTTKFTRRRNSGGIEPLALQKKSDELYAHLKHLGPSNLASKPKSTRINAVKIKPGNPSPNVQSLLSPRASKATEPTFQRSTSRNSLPTSASRNIENVPPENESSGLLAAGFEASDAVRAHIGYGTLSTSPKPFQESSAINGTNSRAAAMQRTVSNPPPRSDPLNIQIRVDDDIDGKISASKPGEIVENEPETNIIRSEEARKNLLSLSQQSPKATSTTSLPAKLVVNPEVDAAPSDDDANNPDEDSSGSTMKSTPSFSLGRKNTARSGSVQERQIDLGGVRKVVLDVHDEEHDPSHRNGDDDNAESEPLLEGSAVLDDDNQDGATSKDKKKRKKKRSKKKKSSGKDGVTSPTES